MKDNPVASHNQSLFCYILQFKKAPNFLFLSVFIKVKVGDLPSTLLW